MNFTFNVIENNMTFVIAVTGVHYDECLCYEKAYIEAFDEDGDIVDCGDDFHFFKTHDFDASDHLEGASDEDGVYIYDALEKWEEYERMDQEMDRAEAMWG